MMNKYTELSDFEINKKVANKLGFQSEIRENGTWIFNKIWIPFDPCNEPGQAMLIIIENKITMAFDIRNNIWCAHSGSVMEDCGWDYEIEPSLFAYSYNYYRAAMEVFLMMRDIP